MCSFSIVFAKYQTHNIIRISILLDFLVKSFYNEPFGLSKFRDKLGTSSLQQFREWTWHDCVIHVKKG